MASLQMTKREREAFLADVHIGIIGIADAGRAPLTVPIWYVYEPAGLLTIVTGRASRKGVLIEKERRFSLCAQTEDAPYKYVSVEGPVTAIEPSVEVDEVRALAHRYLGPQLGDMYIESTGGPTDDDVTVRMRPEHWLTVDYSKRFS